MTDEISGKNTDQQGWLAKATKHIRLPRMKDDQYWIEAEYSIEVPGFYGGGLRDWRGDFEVTIRGEHFLGEELHNRGPEYWDEAVADFLEESAVRLRLYINEHKETWGA